MWRIWLHYVPALILLVLGLSVGTFMERRHFRSLDRREAELQDILVTDVGRLPEDCSAEPFGFVVGEVVIASDYFKSFAAKLRKLIGGDLRAFESLMERARREALVRLLQNARAMGANRVLNVRFASSNIGSMKRNRAAAMVEMYAYGTAVHVSPDARG